MSSRFNCFRDSSSSPVVVTDSPTSARCQPHRQVSVEMPERRCSLQDPAVQRCVATELQQGLATRRLAGPQARRRGCSAVQCGTVTDGAPAGWIQLGLAGAVSGCRKDMVAVSSPGVSPSSSSRSLHYLLQSPVRRYDSTSHQITCPIRQLKCYRPFAQTTKSVDIRFRYLLGFLLAFGLFYSKR